MTSLQEATSLVTRGTDLADRIEGLATAVDAARGRLADADLDRAAGVVSRAAARMKLSSDHTVVAIAGAVKYHLDEADFRTTSRPSLLHTPMKLTSSIDRS